MLSDNNLLFRLDSAIAAARGAGVLILDREGTGLGIESKGLNDIVTEVDGESERYIVDYLSSRFPDDNFLGEENGEISGRSGGRWIIDPIDGTENFSRGIPNYTISIGYEVLPGKPVIGVVYNPKQDEMFHAVKGGGAFLNYRPVKVSEIADPADSLTIVAPPFRSHDKAGIYFKLLESVFLKTRDVRRFGSAAQDLCYIACGRMDAFFELGLKYYDIAAGLIILSEAGGCYSSFTEGEDLLESGNIVATNGLLHQWYKKQINDIIVKN